MKIKAILLLCLFFLVGCNSGGDGDVGGDVGGESDGGSTEMKVFSMPTEKSSSDFLENNNISYNVKYYNLSTGEQTFSGTGRIWGREYPEQIDGIERNITEFLVDLVINGTSQTTHTKTYIVTNGVSWYKYNYETRAIIKERLYSSSEVLSGDLDYLPAIAEIGDFGDLPDYQIIDNSYLSDVVKRTENSWRLIEKSGKVDIVAMSTSYNSYDEKIRYSETTLTINEYGEILGIEVMILYYRDNMKMVVTMDK